MVVVVVVMVVVVVVVVVLEGEMGQRERPGPYVT